MNGFKKEKKNGFDVITRFLISLQSASLIRLA